MGILSCFSDFFFNIQIKKNPRGEKFVNEHYGYGVYQKIVIQKDIFDAIHLYMDNKLVTDQKISINIFAIYAKKIIFTRKLGDYMIK